MRWFYGSVDLVPEPFVIRVCARVPSSVRGRAKRRVKTGCVPSERCRRLCVHSSLIRAARMQTMREGEQRRVLWPPPVLEVAEVPAEGLVVEKPGLGKVCSAGTAWVIYGCEAGGGTRRAHGASSLDWRAFARTRARPRAERWKPRYELTSARGKVLASPERSLSRQICRSDMHEKKRTMVPTALVCNCVLEVLEVDILWGREIFEDQQEITTGSRHSDLGSAA